MEIKEKMLPKNLKGIAKYLEISGFGIFIIISVLKVDV